MNGSEAEAGGEMAKVQPALHDLVDYMRQSHAKQNRLRWYNRAATLVIIIVFLVYILLFVQMFKNNLSAEKFTKHVQESMGQMAPVITDASLEVITSVSPIYLEKATAKMDELTPEIMAGLEDQTDEFIKNMSLFAETKFRAGMHRIVENTAAEFRKQYPDLTDEQIEQFIGETEKDFKAMFEDLSVHIIDQSLPEIAEMKYISESMVDENMDGDTMALYQQFLHKLLILLDKEIMMED